MIKLIKKVWDITDTKYVRIKLNIQIKTLFIKYNTVVKILKEKCRKNVQQATILGYF